MNKKTLLYLENLGLESTNQKLVSVKKPNVQNSLLKKLVNAKNSIQMEVVMGKYLRQRHFNQE